MLPCTDEWNIAFSFYRWESHFSPRWATFWVLAANEKHLIILHWDALNTDLTGYRRISTEVGYRISGSQHIRINTLMSRNISKSGNEWKFVSEDVAFFVTNVFHNTLSNFKVNIYGYCKYNPECQIGYLCS
jgi:hypothetical protein